MTRRARRTSALDPFAIARSIGLTMPGVEAGTKYDGSPVLKLGGAFMAGLATDDDAEPGTLVVRATLEDRALMIEDAPDTYYITEYHEKHPVVLVRLARIAPDTLRDVLDMSRRLTVPKTRKGR
jgi:hypothetical protein